MHYGTFPLLAGTPDQLRADLAERGLGDVAVRVTTPGASSAAERTDAASSVEVPVAVACLRE